MSKLGAAAVRARDHLLEGGGFDALIVRFESGLRMPDAGATAANYVRRIL
ncbi:MAG: hypothetical protein GWN71_02085, partial [Gammaproteobacteria bacterium]|nr:hypothetical protein [Gemmatimonadota bacterium]NIU72402.1 hypothetical protein [Gammaproteobacteria bacterium]